MKTMHFSLRERLRITWVIAMKDLREAVKNKNTFTVILAALFIVAIYRLLPVLTSSMSPPELIVYDPGNSQIIARLETSDSHYLVKSSSMARMESRVAASEAPYLGLVIPTDFDQQAGAGQTQEMQGTIIYWASNGKAEAARLAAEAELTHLAGAPVRVNPDLTRIYPSASENALGNWAALTLVFAMMTITVQLIPNLMLEEKNTHTLETLLISPASAWELAAGKAVAGLFYALLSSAVIVIIFIPQIIHLSPLLLAIGAGALFMVLVGLLTGLKVDSRGQLSIYVVVLGILLFIPVVVYLVSDLFPGNLETLMRWLPTNAMYHLMQAAFGETLEITSMLLDTSILLFWGLLVGTGLVWQLRRMDRTPGWKSGSLQSLLTPGGKPVMNPTISPPIFSEGAINHRDRSTQPFQNPKISWRPSAQAIKPPHPLRILRAIAIKDLREAFHNKVILAILITSLLMIALNSSLPLLFRFQPGSVILVIDRGGSQVLQELKEDADLLIRQVGSQSQMEQALAGSMQTSLGVELPADFDQRLAQGETVTITGYAAHWTDPSKVNAAMALLNQALSEIDAGEIALASQIQYVYPGENHSGQPFMISMVLVFLTMVMGIALTPVLFVEEKESHTLSALLVSPARPHQIVAGKGLAGIVFGLLSAAVVLLANRYLFVQWDVLLLAVLSSLVFTVALGLFLGVCCDNPSTLGLWGALVMLFLIATTLSAAYLKPDTGWLNNLLSWTPGAIMLQLVHLSMSRMPDVLGVLVNIVSLMILGALFFWMTVRKISSWS